VGFVSAMLRFLAKTIRVWIVNIKVPQAASEEEVLIISGPYSSGQKEILNSLQQPTELVGNDFHHK
jgi:hypothetical protein